MDTNELNVPGAENDLRTSAAQVQPDIHAGVDPQTEVPMMGQPCPAMQDAVRAEPRPTAVPVRKESPFANSPYVTAVPVQQGNQTQRPAQPQTAAPVKPTVSSDTNEKRGRKPWMAVISGVAVFALIVGSCTTTAACLNSYWKEQNEQLSKSFNEKLNVLEEKLEAKYPNAGTNGSVSGTPDTPVSGAMTPAQVYAQNVESVVAINCTATTNEYGQLFQSASSGSGFVLTEDGYVVTNYHVVKGASTIKVATSDGASYNAEYIGGDEFNDVALLKMEAEGLRAAAIGKSDDLIVGDQVAAIGNPLGELASTLTVGYVSAKDRIVTTDGTQINMLQTDAAINPGNSGGPLFNMYGEVVGITTAKYSGTTDSGASIEGIGFAIPIDDVIGMLEDLQEFGHITGAYMGVTVSDVDLEAAELYGLPMGALVREVTSGSCAEAAGIRAQDIIVNLGGHDIEGLNDLTRTLRKFKAGDTVTVTVYRGGSEVILSITLDEKPGDTEQSGSDVTEPTVEGQLPSGGTAEDWFDHFFG